MNHPVYHQQIIVNKILVNINKYISNNKIIIIRIRIRIRTRIRIRIRIAL